MIYCMSCCARQCRSTLLKYLRYWLRNINQHGRNQGVCIHAFIHVILKPSCLSFWVSEDRFRHLSVFERFRVGVFYIIGFEMLQLRLRNTIWASIGTLVAPGSNKRVLNRALKWAFDFRCSVLFFLKRSCLFL